MEKDNLPIYELILNGDEHGTQAISLVDEPAIQVNWFAFKDMLTLAELKEQQKLAGAFLIPEQKIYRRDESGEYYIKFSKETIQEIADKFNAEQRGRSINLMHEDGSTLSTAYVAENWIVDAELDKSKKFGFELPEGTWFGLVKIEDENFWKEEIKTQRLRGFSIEGFFDMQKVKMSNNIKMEYGKFKLEKEATLEDGTVIYTTASDFEVGAPVFVVDENGQQFAAPNGDHVISGYGIISVMDGLITEVVKEEAPAEESAPAEPMEESAPVEQATAPVKAEVTPEDIANIMAQVQPMLDELNARVSALEQRFNEIEGGVNDAISEMKETKENLSTQLSEVKDNMPSNSVTAEVKVSKPTALKQIPTTDEILENIKRIKSAVKK